MDGAAGSADGAARQHQRIDDDYHDDGGGGEALHNDSGWDRDGSEVAEGRSGYRTGAAVSPVQFSWRRKAPAGAGFDFMGSTLSNPPEPRPTQTRLNPTALEWNSEEPLEITNGAAKSMGAMPASGETSATLENVTPLTGIQLLASIFVDTDPSILTQTLERCGGDISAALDVLTTDGTEEPGKTKPLSSGQGPQSTKSVVVCKYFSAGTCYRADCWYSHEVETCRFWLSGYCREGPNCRFLHGQAASTTQSVANLSPSSTSPQPAPLAPSRFSTAAEFPALSSSLSSKTNRIDFWGPTSKFSEVTKQNSGPAKKSPPKLKSVSAGTAASLQRRNEGKVKLNSERMKWVSTGGSVQSLYENVRKEAAAAAIERNKLFQKATDAYNAGNKAAARAFSQEARRVNEVLEELQKEAAQHIFKSRNANDKNLSDGTERLLDLHGLHPKEAIGFVKSSMEQLKRERFDGTLTLITGTGHHSRGGPNTAGKVGPLLREHLREQRIKFKEATMEDGRGGMFIVYCQY